MTPTTNKLPRILLSSTLALAAVGTFLLPGGSALSHLAFEATLLGTAAWLAALSYAMLQDEESAPVDSSLRPEVAWLSFSTDLVPHEALEGPDCLLALVREGEVPHPDLAATLAPYFADPSVAFVQGATRYDGEGGVADAFRSLSAIDTFAERERSKLNAATLTGSGALLSREAAREVYRPGDTWQTLGLRLVAAGYTGRYIAEPTVLAWAPQDLSSMGASIVVSSRRALARLVVSVRMYMPLSLRLQSLSTSAGTLAVWFAAATGALSSLSLVFFDVGPVILNSPGAWVGDAVAVLALGAGVYAWQKIVGINPLAPMAVAVVGAYRASYDYAYAVATGPAARRARRSAAQAYQSAVATVRAGGSAGTAPAGTPARS